nr:MAG TPA: hypothetical protein [Caudoviricetes sp.]
MRMLLITSLNASTNASIFSTLTLSKSFSFIIFNPLNSLISPLFRIFGRFSKWNTLQRYRKF